MYTNTPLTPLQRANLHEKARREAGLLRRAAADDFWHAAYRLAVDAMRAARHALHRVAPQSNRHSGA